MNYYILLVAISLGSMNVINTMNKEKLEMNTGMESLSKKKEMSESSCCNSTKACCESCPKFCMVCCKTSAGLCFLCCYFCTGGQLPGWE